MPLTMIWRHFAGAILVLAIAVFVSACWGDGRSFAVWVESRAPEPVIVVLSSGTDAPDFGRTVAYLAREGGLHQSTRISLGAGEDSRGTIRVYSVDCVLRGTVEVRAGAYHLSIAADGTYELSGFGGLSGNGPDDAPDLESTSTDCAP